MYRCDIVLTPAGATGNDVVLRRHTSAGADVYLYPRSELSNDIWARRQRYDVTTAEVAGPGTTDCTLAASQGQTASLDMARALDGVLDASQGQSADLTMDRLLDSLLVASQGQTASLTMGIVGAGGLIHRVVRGNDPLGSDDWWCSYQGT